MPAADVVTVLAECTDDSVVLFPDDATAAPLLVAFTILVDVVDDDLIKLLFVFVTCVVDAGFEYSVFAI